MGLSFFVLYFFLCVALRCLVCVLLPGLVFIVLPVLSCTVVWFVLSCS